MIPCEIEFNGSCKIRWVGDDYWYIETDNGDSAIVANGANLDVVFFALPFDKQDYIMYDHDWDVYYYCWLIDEGYVQ